MPNERVEKPSEVGELLAQALARCPPGTPTPGWDQAAEFKGQLKQAGRGARRAVTRRLQRRPGRGRLRRVNPSPASSSKLLRSLACALALSALAGCADLLKLLQTTSFQNPTLSFVRATPRSLQLDQLTLDVTFRVENPNPQGLSLARASCALALEGKTVASTAPQAGLEIPASGAAEVIFPTTVRLGELAGGLQAALEKKVLHWKASGELGVQSPLGVIALLLSAEGDLPVPQPPKVSLGSPRVSMQGFTRLLLTLPLSVENPNAFPLPLGVVGGALGFAGAQVGRVDADGKGEAVPAGGKHTLLVSVGLDLLAASAAVASAVSAGEADFTLDGSISSGSATLPLKVQQHLSLLK